MRLKFKYKLGMRDILIRKKPGKNVQLNTHFIDFWLDYDDFKRIWQILGDKIWRLN